MPELPRMRLLRAIRALVVDPEGRDARALLAAIETALGEREAEVRAGVLTAAADRAEQINPDRCPDFSEGVDWVVGELRAAAVEVTL